MFPLSNFPSTDPHLLFDYKLTLILVGLDLSLVSLPYHQILIAVVPLE